MLLAQYNRYYEFLIHRPLILMVLMTLPLLFVARRWGLFPSKRMLYLVTVPAVLSLILVQDPTHGGKIAGLSFLQWFLIVIAVVDVTIFLFAAFDLFRSVKSKNFSCERNLLRIASQGKPHRVEIELTNRSRQGCSIVLCDDLPQSFTADPDEFEARIDGKSKTQFSYDFIGNERGSAEFEHVHVLVHSPFRLWRGYYKIPCPSVVNVYPDMKQIAEYDLMARTNRLNLLGMRRSRKIGQDNEFERLRDYTQDDNYKHIDWRATARRRKLTVRDFQANQSQRIVFMVDCGRMMTGMSEEGISLLDHSLNAMLMLSYIALRQGDSVGMIMFSDKIHNFIPPKNGVKHINRLLHASSGQQAEFVESRYDDAFLYLRTHCHKRSLVVLLTNVIDEINAHQVKQYMTSLTGRHLPMSVLLRDHELFSAVDEYEADPNGQSVVYQAAAAVEVLDWRHQVISDLKHRGVLALDIFPENLTAELVNQYLEIKARHLL